MEVDILVNGNKIGVAKIVLEIPNDLKARHCIGTSHVLKAIQQKQKVSWYCMGDVEVVPPQTIIEKGV